MSMASLSQPRNKHYIILIFLVFLSIFFIILQNSLQISKPNYISPQKFTFTIKLLAYNRLNSLKRCLNSLSSANYSNDTIHLHIYIDHFVNSSNSFDVGQKLELWREMLAFVDGFEWKFGLKVVHYRSVNVGLQAQWLEAWWPSFDDEFVFVVEDDVEVSTEYYLYLKRLILWYYYDPTNFSPLVFGASLQRPRFVPDDLLLCCCGDAASIMLLLRAFATFSEASGLRMNNSKSEIYFNGAGDFLMHDISQVSGLRRGPLSHYLSGKHGNKMNLDSGTNLFLYQLVGTWGQLLFPKPWKEFRLWYDDHKARGIKPFLEGMVTNGWYKKMGERIWTPWFIKFIHSHGYFNIYTNFPNETALSVSHRDAGVNYGKTIGPDSQLLNENLQNVKFLTMQPLSNLKWYDFCFRKVLPGRVANHLDEVAHILHTMEQQKPILLVSILEASAMTVRNLICHFERLNIQSYIFMIPRSKSDLLADLARRGHPTINTEEVFDSIFRSKKSTHEVIKDMIVKVHVINKCLESGFDTWVISDNMLPLSNNPVLDSGGSTDDFYIGKGSRQFIARSSSSSCRIWGEIFVQKLTDTVASRDGGDFIDVVEKFSEKQGLRLKIIDEIGLSLKLETANVNQTVFGNAKTISWLPATDIDFVRERLERLGLWIVDGDSSCKAVVCHQS